ncbi:MAG: PAS domain-containing protein [Desulfomonile sp.]|nr:PAS domain-containing protein [Desulfomonile sp.]
MVRSTIGLVKRFMGSLSFKLSFLAGVVIFVAVVTLAYYAISRQQESLVHEKIQGALKDSEVIKAAIWNGMMTKDREGIRQIVRAIGAQENFKEINIYDQKGALLYSSREGSPFEPLRDNTSPSNPLLADLGTNTALRYRFSDDGQTLSVVNPLHNTAGCSTAACHAHPPSERVLGALEVNIPLLPLRKKLREYTTATVLFAFLLFLIISTFVGLAVMIGIVPPLTRLKEEARRMARGQYSPGPDPSGGDEISELTRVFNDMSRQINDRTRQLAESRKTYKDLFEKVPCYLTVVSRDYRIVRANQAFKEEFGDLVGRECFSSFKGLSGACKNCPVKKTFQDGAPHRSEEVWSIGPEGRKVYVVVHTAPIFDYDGKVLEVLEMSVDVTRQEKLHRELRKKEEQFRNLFENVPCYLTVIDGYYRIAFYNKIFARDFGDSWGKHCFEIYKNRDTRCENCPVKKTFADGNSHASEEVWNRGGQDVFVVINTSPITDEEGRTVAVMEMCTNVTELKLLQNELAVLGETVAGMSHSVKNVLSGLEGGVYIVDSGLKKGREDRVQAGWDMVKRHVEKEGHSLRSKERRPEYRECDPGTLLADVCDLFRAKAASQNVELVCDFDPVMGTAVLDPSGIHNAVTNLVSNAIAACRSVSGEKHHVTLSGRMTDAALVIEVIDDGIGMPEEVQQNLFRKFYSTKGSKGTGLGLVATRKVVEEHGGTIAVTSGPGEGTTFTLRIPVNPNAAKKAS